MTECVLCGSPAGEVRAAEHWRVVVNRNQNLLGKTMLVLRRHAERVVELTDGEWAELRVLLAEVTARLDAAFSPDHYNCAFLQNADRHVHLHVIPRYASARELGGERFDDPDYPEHYAVPSPVRLVSRETVDLIAAKLA